MIVKTNQNLILMQFVKCNDVIKYFLGIKDPEKIQNKIMIKVATTLNDAHKKVPTRSDYHIIFLNL